LWLPLVPVNQVKLKIDTYLFYCSTTDLYCESPWSLLFWDGFFKDFSKKNAVYRVLWALVNLQSWFYYVYTLYSHPSCDTSSVLDSSHFIFPSPSRFLLSVGQPLIFYFFLYIYIYIYILYWDITIACFVSHRLYFRLCFVFVFNKNNIVCFLIISHFLYYFMQESRWKRR